MKPGFWTRSNSEICISGTKDRLKRGSKAVQQVCGARIMEHSKKPDEIWERIMELCGNLPRIELFARQQFEGMGLSWGRDRRREHQASNTGGIINERRH